ncbi:hypothetical protein SZ64_14155 [Erythrobacter sp. SG61-1L]|uniref:hypothetical protein n=1 Tax=Erythrobacter sp. SG61-1L TaxID=1603897 RepID=UPI0006C8ED1C|nr:hypothetical protein [Erythrobacter sp. SG61-1L]KPL69149.1 hypothetical protein SZ64_14155 [Erythrobacter sp. SG61-1L]
MNAVPPNMIPHGDSLVGTPHFAEALYGATAAQWAALQDAAAVVAHLAGIEPEQPTPEIIAFPETIRHAGAWRRQLAEKGIDDLAAILEPGITALLAVNARGADTTAPAQALWHEFLAARTALLSLAPHGMIQRKRMS